MKSEKQNAPINTQTQDLAVFGFRLAVVVALTAILLFGGGNTGVTGTQGVFMAFLVSLAAGLVLVVFAMVPSLNPYAMWAVMIGDWVTVGAFGLVVYDNPPLVLLLLVGVGAVSHVRLGALWGAVSNAVNVLVFAGVMGYAAGTVDRMTALLPSYGVMLALLVVVTAGIATLMHLRDSQLQSRTLSMRTQAEQRMAMVKDMQERTVAITEMAQMLGSTLNYQRILDAALSVGRLALHEKNNTGFISMVLLFRPEDRMLYIETARGLSRHDEQRVVAGKAGLVGDTLRLCEPMFGGVIRKDPELRQFHSLQQARSLVTVPLRAGYDNYGVMVFASQQPNAFNERYQVFLEAVGIHTTIALQNAVLYQNLADEKERLVEVEEEARQKLARDLHDGPTQAVSAIAMRMSALQQMVHSNPDRVIKELGKMEDLARKTTSEIRGMMFTLRPLALESQGLNAALEQLAEKMDAIYDQGVEVIVSPDAESVLTQHQSGTIFYIIEEAVNNARKHAEADVIYVRVSRYEDVVLVEIKDDGLGFDVAAVSENYEGRTSLGMVNLHERTDLVDGTLTIDSTPGKGTTVSVVVPVDPTGTRSQPPKRKAKSEPPKRVFRLSAMR